MSRKNLKTSVVATLLLAVPLALLACGDAVTPTQPAPLAATAVATPAPSGSSVVAPGAAQEFMLRARGETAGPFGGPPLVGTAWVHITGEPETASVTVVTTGLPGPDGIPTSHFFDLGSGDSFTTADLATLDPPFVGPGEYALASTVTIVGGTGVFAGLSGTLEISKGTLTVSPEFMAAAEWHMRGRVRLDG